MTDDEDKTTRQHVSGEKCLSGKIGSLRYTEKFLASKENIIVYKHSYKQFVSDKPKSFYGYIHKLPQQQSISGVTTASQSNRKAIEALPLVEGPSSFEKIRALIHSYFFSRETADGPRLKE
jgi:hypothetical protein